MLLNERVSPGPVTFDVRVDAEGVATAAWVAGEIPPDLQGCMIDVFQGYRHPAGPAAGQVTYTLVVTP